MSAQNTDEETLRKQRSDECTNQALLDAYEKVEEENKDREKLAKRVSGLVFTVVIFLITIRRMTDTDFNTIIIVGIFLFFMLVSELFYRITEFFGDFLHDFFSLRRKGRSEKDSKETIIAAMNVLPVEKDFFSAYVHDTDDLIAMRDWINRGGYPPSVLHGVLTDKAKGYIYARIKAIAIAFLVILLANWLI